jgi:hypothetical protein
MKNTTGRIFLNYLQVFKTFHREIVKKEKNSKQNSKLFNADWKIL